MSKKKIALFYGTRPEIIKVAPLIHEFQKYDIFDLTVINTGQHVEISKEIENVFNIVPNIVFNSFEQGQQLGKLFSKILNYASDFLSKSKPDLVFVQGDTSSVLAVSIACFYQQIPLAHIEAGLRSFQIKEPFPEEFNRRVTSIAAQLHFAPTSRAAKNLLAEGIQADSIFITGNTVVDACTYVNNNILTPINSIKKQILITAHRRENLEEGLYSICEAVKIVLNSYPNVNFIWPLHPNPAVQLKVRSMLDNINNIELVPAMNYVDLLRELRDSYIIWSDSGGIQEEVPTFKKPILILRNTTERPEVIEEGFGVLVGTDTAKIVEYTEKLINDQELYSKMVSGKNPFGDGNASKKIVEETCKYLNCKA